MNRPVTRYIQQRGIAQSLKTVFTYEGRVSTHIIDYGIRLGLVKFLVGPYRNLMQYDGTYAILRLSFYCKS